MVSEIRIRETPLPIIESVAFALGCGLCLLLNHLDASVFKHLVDAFGMAYTAALPAGDSVISVLYMMLCGILGAVTLLATRKCTPQNRPIVLFQIAAVSLVIQALVWEFFHLHGHLLAFSLMVAIGAAAGCLLRKRENDNKTKEAQYHELIMRNRELMATRIQLVKQEEIDRRLLAGDLHDQVLNDLKAALHCVNTERHALDPKTAAKLTESLERAMGCTREVMDSLFPAVVDHLGIEGALEDCLDRGSDRADFDSFFDCQVPESVLARLDKVDQLLLYRLVQESVTNICKHAKASKVDCAITYAEECIIVKIADDGRGINPQLFSKESRGLRYMRQRADLLGAILSWSTGLDGRGTTVEIRINMKGRGIATGPDC
jgi:signal transduction histidine kinase